MISTRRATREDLQAIVEVNKSDVDEWHRWSRQGIGAKSTYKELSGWERQIHGGPWLHLKALERYWDYMEKTSITCLVAEIEGNVVGHLDVFMVHKGYRRRGVATALLKTARDFAVKHSLQRIIVMTEYDGAGGLTYRKNGYTIFQEMYSVESTIKDPEMPRGLSLSNPPGEPPLRSHHMVCGWWNTPSKNWMDSFHPGEINRHLDWHQILLTCETGSGKVHMSLKSGFPDRTEADICLWLPEEVTLEDLLGVVEAAKSIVASWGATKLTSVILEEDRVMLERVGFMVKNRRDPMLSLVVDT